MPTSTELITTTLTETFDLDPSEVTPERTFEELGLDSLALVEMGLMLQERTGVTLNDVPLHTTVGGLAALIDRAEADRAGADRAEADRSEADRALTAAPNSTR
ncbi:acyl carrier protein [Streptomyces kronopolitis]|uniref:acyl carrier protein n=1 Tax=Streptomyces kronopolitis TaxID=1612435 RepID=UPI0020C11254|nr:acyl carrier protein [Streptomyces kronopolitis]MCL6299921.1 acyl carrier protein [Streptomyces kronopolitis]